MKYLERNKNRIFLSILILMVIPSIARAGTFELSTGFSFSETNYSDSNYEWNRRWGLSLGYHLTETSEIEFSFSDSFDRTIINGFEDTSFHDQIYGLNWVQAIVGKDFPIQPYFKIGIGQLNRDASGNYFGGAAAPPAILDTLTGILGVGCRIYLTKTFGLRGEGTTYLTGGSIRTWNQNFAITGGISLFF